MKCPFRYPEMMGGTVGRRVNKAKRRMLQGKPAIGVIAGLGSPLAVEGLSLAGLDYVLIDNQHGYWSDDSSLIAFRSVCLGSATPMARARQNDFYAIGKLLDGGAMGIVVPMVNSVAEAERAAYAVRYPPRGGRSAGAYGSSFLGANYMKWIDDEVFLAVQIESQKAVNEAEEILAVDGVDGCWIGAYDLANDMGIDQSTPAGLEAQRSAIMQVFEACKKTNKIPGIASTLEDVRYWLDQGFLFVTIGSDRGLMVSKAAEVLPTLL